MTGRQFNLEVRDNLPDRIDDLLIRRWAATRHVIDWLAELIGGLQQGDGASGIFDVALIAAVQGMGRPKAHLRQIRILAFDRRMYQTTWQPTPCWVVVG